MMSRAGAANKEETGEGMNYVIIITYPTDQRYVLAYILLVDSLIITSLHVQVQIVYGAHEATVQR